jgi:hypothetical protein
VKVVEVTREGDAIVVMVIERASKSRSGRQMKFELDDEEARRLMNALRRVLPKRRLTGTQVIGGNTPDADLRGEGPPRLQGHAAAHEQALQPSRRGSGFGDQPSGTIGDAEATVDNSVGFARS